MNATIVNGIYFFIGKAIAEALICLGFLTFIFIIGFVLAFIEVRKEKKKKKRK